MISSDGVLSFKFSPDYEMPMGTALDTDNTNTYKVVVAASDDAPGAGDMIKRGYKKVTVMVTDVEEPGMVALSARRPQVGQALTATLTDDDATSDQIAAATWMWERASAMGKDYTVIIGATAASYPPVAGVVGNYLRAKATYTDRHGSEKIAMSAASAYKVRAAPNANAAPGDEAVDRSVDENSPPGTRVGKPVTATDPNSDVLTYSLGTGNDNANYRIDPGTGQITVGPRVMLDHEANESDIVSVTATDPSDETGTVTVTVTIKDVNEVPMITGGPTKISNKVEDDADDVDTDDETVQMVGTYMATDPESEGEPVSEGTDAVCEVASCIWSLKGTDSGDFNISNVADSLGQLTFKEAPNFEMPADSNRDNVYMVTVVVTDVGLGGKNKMTAERDVVITVTNVEEDGTVTLLSVQPKIGVELIAEVTDLDGGVKDITWQWHRNLDAAAADDTWQLIEDAKSKTYTPVADDAVVTGDSPRAAMFLRATAMYTDDKGMDTAMAVSANAVVVDYANRAPVFKPKPQSLSVMEDAAAGAVVGQVEATDPNGDNLTYTLGGTDAGKFMITSQDDDTTDVDEEGQITVKAGTKLDYDGSKKTHKVTVTATDPDGASDSVDVTIKLIDVDEAPMIAGDDIRKDYSENGMAQVARFTADDPEDRMVYWSLADAEVTDKVDTGEFEDYTHFMISSDGVLSFKFSPDYEMPMGTALDTDNKHLQGGGGGLRRRPRRLLAI